MSVKEKSWVKFYPPKIPDNIDYPEIPLHDILIRTSKNYPDQVAIDYFGNEITYKEIDSFSDCFAAGLAKLGIKKGDRIALFLPNIPQFIIAYFGILKVGAIVTTISPLYKDREVKYQLINSGAKSIVTLTSLFPIVEKIWQKTKLQNIILTTATWQLPCIDYSQIDSIYKEKILFFEKIITENSASIIQKVKINPRIDLAALQYTGGTTGRAKGAMLTHMNLVSNAIMFATWIQAKKISEKFLDAGILKLFALTLFHVHCC